MRDGHAVNSTADTNAFHCALVLLVLGCEYSVADAAIFEFERFQLGQSPG